MAERDVKRSTDIGANNDSHEEACRWVKDEILSPLLKEYDDFSKALQSQVDLYKKEHQNLRSQMSGLVQENQSLSDQLKIALNTRIPAGDYLNTNIFRKDSDVVTNLQQQLVLTTQEKESAVQMWQTASREIDALEQELKAYHENQHLEIAEKHLDQVKREYSAAISMLESKLSAVRNELNKERSFRETTEADLCKLRDANSKLERNIKNSEHLLEEALNGQKNAMQKLQESQDRELSLTNTIESLTTSRDELEMALKQCHKRIEELLIEEKVARNKVQEALTIVENALIEKDAAILRETKTLEENVNLKRTMKELVEEAGVRVKEEIKRVKQKYNDQMNIVLVDMKDLQMKLDAKELEISRMNRERDMLEADLQRARCDKSTVESGEITKLENSVKSLYEELSAMERRCYELNVEKDQLLVKMHAMQERHLAEIKEKSHEREFMEEQVIELQSALEKAIRAQSVAETQLKTYIDDIKSLDEQLLVVNSTPTRESADWNTPKNSQDNDSYASQLQEIERREIETANELTRHLESQMAMKKKWQSTVKSITEKFELRIQALCAKTSQLKKVKRQLEKELEVAHKELANYRNLEGGNQHYPN